MRRLSGAGSGGMVTSTVRRSGQSFEFSPQVRNHSRVTTYRIAEAAELLGVSDDTMRRWVDAGRIATDTASRAAVDHGRRAPTWPGSPRSSPTTPTATAPAPARSAPATG